MREAEEGFRAGQKGSSAMPHKRNPITAERLTGLARILRGNLQAGLEDVALWHERDISHSSVERVILPDSSHLAYYSLRRAASLVDDLQVDPARMLDNLDRSYGLVFSQPVLLALVASGLTRDDRLPRRAGRRHEGVERGDLVPDAAGEGRAGAADAPSSSTRPSAWSGPCATPAPSSRRWTTSGEPAAPRRTRARCAISTTSATTAS